jgi:cobalt/nickel transport system permease protein
MIPAFLISKEASKDFVKSKGHNTGFVDQTTRKIAAFILMSVQQWHLSQKKGLMQAIDSRVKVIITLLFIILVSIVHTIWLQLIIAAIPLSLFLLSKINIFTVYQKVLLITLLFGVLISLPGSLSVFSPGKIIIPIFNFDRAYHWWIYTVPRHIGITYEGKMMVARISLKIFNSIAFTFLLIRTTTFEHIVKSLAVMKVPDIFLLTLTMSYKFIYILACTVEESYYALKMRWWNRGSVAHAEEIIAGRLGYIYNKAWERHEWAHKSMVARGFTGKVNIGYFMKLRTLDFIFAIVMLCIVVTLIVLNYYG